MQLMEILMPVSSQTDKHEWLSSHVAAVESLSVSFHKANRCGIVALIFPDEKWTGERNQEFNDLKTALKNRLNAI